MAKSLGTRGRRLGTSKTTTGNKRSKTKRINLKKRLGKNTRSVSKGSK